jgi:hypothetical protein
MGACDGNVPSLFLKPTDYGCSSRRLFREDAAGNIWIGFVGGGLARWPDASHSAEADGLPARNVGILYSTTGRWGPAYRAPFRLIRPRITRA